MKAICQSLYGDPGAVLDLRDVPEPDLGDHDVLVRVRATSVHADVWHAVTGNPALLRLTGAGLRRPHKKIPGTDVSGVVEAVGKNVTQFRVGEDVFGEPASQNLWIHGGTFAEFAAVPEDALVHKPKTVSHDQAVAVTTSGIIALNNLQPPCGIQPGWNVLINGAGGGVGSVVVQLAKARGARVTAIDDARKQSLLRSLGADVVIDYATGNMTEWGGRYDLILDVASTLTFTACRRMLQPGGFLVHIGHDHYGKYGGRWLGSIPRFLRLAACGLFFPQLRPRFYAPLPKRQALAVLADGLEARNLTPVIARVYPLAEAREALRFLVSGEACGKIILRP